MEKELIILKSDFFTIKQKIWIFYVCKMKPFQLKDIAKRDIDRYKSMDEIQRELRGERTKEIKEYIYWKDYATFPNSFIISVWNDSYIDENWNLNIIGEAYILDWQHRLSWFKDDEKDFEIIVSVFIWLDKFHQAMIFANINWLQMKVNKSLIYSLYWFWDLRTPELISYSIISLLNKEKHSPWHELINILWKWSWTLSLAPFFESLVYELKEWVFKSYYSSDSEKFDNLLPSDDKLYFVLADYFSAVKNVFQDEWGNKDYILNKTTWFFAFFRLLVYIFKKKSYNKFPYFNQPTIDSFTDIIKKAKSNLTWTLISDNYESWAKWQNKLYNELIENLF